MPGKRSARTHRTRRARQDDGALGHELAARLAELFKALADATRLRILSHLAWEEHCVHDLVLALDMEQSAISHQLRLLRDRGIVSHRKEGRHVYYRLEECHVRDVFAFGLEHVEHTAQVSPRKAKS